MKREIKNVEVISQLEGVILADKPPAITLKTKPKATENIPRGSAPLRNSEYKIFKRKYNIIIGSVDEI
jgi:hypothetical protein